MPSINTIVIVAQPADTLAARVRDVLHARGADVRWFTPARLGTVPVTLSDRAFVVDGSEVAALLWRVSPDMLTGDGFQDADRNFASSETAATWIAALNLPTISAINRFDAQSWYSGLRTHYWRDRLADAGVDLTPMAVGRVPDSWQWMPYTTGELSDPPDERAWPVMACASHPPGALTTVITLAGETDVADVPANVTRAANTLHQWGIEVAAIDVDASGRIHRLRVLPAVEDHKLDYLAARLAEYLNDDCIARRS